MAELDLRVTEFGGRTRELGLERRRKGVSLRQMERDGYRPRAFISMHWELNCAPWPNEM